MKYDKEHIATFLTSINNGDGRVRACKATGIDYQTFLDWMADPRKPEFSEAVKKAELVGEDKIKDLAKRGIIEKFGNQWQAAAWWLERKYPDEYKNRTDIMSGNEKIQPPAAAITIEYRPEKKNEAE